MIDKILEKDAILKRLMEARINGKGIELSEKEVFQITSSVFVGTIFDEVLTELLFNEKYKIKNK